MGLFDSIKKFVDNIFGAIGDVLGYVLGIDTDLEDKYKGQLINKSSNIQKIPVIYGERLVGGTRVFVSTGGGKKNQYLYIALVLSEGEVDSIGDIYINDIISTDSRFTNKATIYKYRGTDNQAATTLFADADESWTSAHQLKGVAYLAMRFKYDQDVFTSIPEIRAVVKGKKVYNPATQITEWSDNPALCLRDYLTNPRYGKGLPASAIDDASIIQAASDCDSLVTPYGGATDIPLFKFNAIIDTGETVFDNVKKIIASMRGILPYSNGKYSLLVDKDQSSTFTLTEDNILSDIKIVSSSKENKFNQVTAKFPNPAKRWELDTVTYPDSGSTEETAFLNEDNQQILSKEITLHNVTNAYRAKDLARIACLASRRQSLTVSVTCTSEALNIAVGDIVTIEHDSLGWTGTAVQEFRVMGMVLDDSGEVDLTLQQYDASIYPWVEQSEIPDNPETTLPDPFTTAPVTNQSGTGQAVVQNDGTVTYFYDLEWDEPDDALVEYYLIDVNKTIDEVETLAAETLQTQNLNFRYMVSDTSIDYGFTIRAVNGAGTRSAGVTIPASSVIKDTTPPSVIDAQTTSVVAGLQSITVSWENPTEEDFDLVRIKVNDTNTEPTSHFAATRSDTFIHDIGEYSTIKYYWIAPVDTSGNVADYTFAGSATTGSIDYGDVLNPPTIPEVATTVYLTLGDNNAPTDTEFNTAVGRDPIENDFVVVNKEFAFVYDGSTWSAVTEFIDGSLLVSGSLSADDITTGTLNANDVTISNLTVSYDDLGDKPDLSEFITAGEVNDNVTVINGGIIQTGSAITVGVNDNVAVLSGADATYRLWAGDASSADAPFKVSQTGVLYATGAEISGNITAGSIDAENITFTGSLIADGLSTIPNVEATNMTQSLRNAIEEIIVTKFGSDASTGYYDEATGSFDAQDDNTEICRINTFQHNGSNIDIDVTFSRSWQASSGDIPSVEVNIQRSVAGANSWTTIKTQTITGSVSYVGELGNYFANIQGVVSITDNPTAGNYDYRFFAGTISNLSLITISARLEANEQGEQIGTIDLANYSALAQDETITGNWTFSGTTSGINYNTLSNKPSTTNWDTAYSWGDHSTQNYAVTTGDTFTGNLKVNGGFFENFGITYLRDNLRFINSGANGWHTIIEKNGGNPYFNAIDSYRVNGSTVIDSSRNLTNIGNITASGDLEFSAQTNRAIKIDTTVADNETRDAIELFENDAKATGRQAISWWNGSHSTPYYKARLWTEVGASYNATKFGIDVADNARTVATRLYIEDGNTNITKSLNVAGNIQQGGVTVIDNSRNITGSSITGSSLTVSGSGQYVAGSIYSDGNWGMIFRAKQASPANAQYRWATSADSELMRIDNNGILKVSGDIHSVSDWGGTFPEQITVQGDYASMCLRNEVGNFKHLFHTSGTNFQLYSGANWNNNSWTMKLQIDSTGNLDLKLGDYKVNGITVIDSSRRIDGSGRLRITGGNNTDGNAQTSTGAVIGTYVDQYAFIDLASSHANGSWIDFSYANGTDYGGRIRYTNSGQYFRFYANGAERFHIGNNINNLTGNYLVNGTTVIDSSRNATFASTTTGLIEMNQTSTSGYFGSASFSWAGNSGYPTLYGESADRWVMVCFPHIPYLNSGQRGYTGTTFGSLTRYEAWNGNHYDAGVLSRVGDGRFSISRYNLSTPSITAYSQNSAQHNVNVGGTNSPWNSGNRSTLTVNGGSNGALLGFTNSSGNAGYLYSYGSTLEVLAYGEVKLLSNASASYYGKLNTGLWNVSHGYQVAGSTVIDSSRNLTNITNLSGSVTSTGSVIKTERGQKNIDDTGTYILAKEDGGWGGGARMPSAHNGYGVISMHLHTGSYYGQIHLSANTHDMGVRFQNNTGWSHIYKVCKEDSSGNLTVSGNVTAYSDITLKDNITNIDNALEKVNSIRGVTYDRIDKDNVRQSGVIAQEVEAVLPEVVHTDDDGIKSVAYGNMVGLLIEAIKEQQVQIDELKSKLEK